MLTPADSKVAISAAIAIAASINVIASAAPVPSPSRRSRSSSGSLPERLQDEAVPRLDGPVRRDQIPGRVRRDPRRRQRRDAGDESVDDDGHARGRRAQHDAGQARDLEAAQLCQRVDGVRAIGPVHLEAAANDVDLAAKRRVVDARAPAGDFLGRRAA